MNEVMNTLMSHRSIRAYLDKPVPEADLEKIIKAVQAAPNWVNMQHVSVIAVKDAQRRSLFAGLCGNQKQIAETPVFLVFCADYYRTWLACKRQGQTLEGVMDDLDHVLVSAHEVGIAVGTAVAAAESLGLGTVVIGDIRLHAIDVIRELDLPDYVIPILGLCVGYAAEEPGMKPRLPKEAVYFEETYCHELDEVLDQYDEVYGEYLKARPWNNRVGNWTQLVADFYTAPYSHYPEIREMLAQQGFYK